MRGTMLLQYNRQSTQPTSTQQTVMYTELGTHLHGSQARSAAALPLQR
jgi:hypothetical protein